MSCVIAWSGFAIDRVLQPADPIPAVVVGVEVDAMHAVAARLADLVGQHVGEHASPSSVWPQRHLDGMAGQVVDADERGVPPEYWIASVFGGRVGTMSHVPHPISGHALRARISRLVQRSSDDGSRHCCSTLTLAAE